ncbi:ankyrin repeat domain-containing protein [Mycolicibacterium sp. 050158]|uniref:ankyrin repeat domain-containing protein n=1 Tax=Mycolicibacterium sp. 050158 TaxID=3090602 RepID=UPI00299DD231|nr:ankyrin repeat domain-containing protein [Mycolicibacterium sp. 050158]MDX1890962.1 ankyrin repeat domain-containing protein [Mycolicibacterium sp. 050158]
MAPTLPNNPSLERFRRDARALQRAVRDRDPDALATVSRHHPGGPPADPAAFVLTAAQHVVARSVGFSSWPRLQAYLRTAEALRRDPTTAPGDDPLSRFLSLACLTYSQDDDPARWAAAMDVLHTHPDLPGRSLYAAAAVADPAAVRAHLAAGPDDARSEGGPFGWTALFHLAAARVPQRDPLATARILLAAGADPNAGYLWQGLPTPFTVLTLCFGEGEAGPGRQPRHPAGAELAEILLAAGADPNDAQTLYNRMFGRDDRHLRILLAHGLGHGAGGPWHRRLGEALEGPAEMVRRQVDWARDRGLHDRLELLAAHGFTDGTTPDAPSPWRPRTPEPAIAAAGTPEAVRELAAAGGDLDALVDGHTVLHQAAWCGDVEMVETLLDCGADADAVDAEHGMTPLEWAEYGRAEAAAALLRARRRT